MDLVMKNSATFWWSGRLIEMGGELCMVKCCQTFKA